jgi:hypothetical protein
MADKDFVVKNGLVVNTNLLVANGDSNRVGINNANPDASLTVTGTANISGNVTLSGNVLNVSSYATFTGNVRVQNTAAIDTRLYVGNTTTMVPGLPSIIQAVDNFNGFVMVSSQNLSQLDDACADLLIYADNTNGLSHFNDLGINNSRFDGTIHRISANTQADNLVLGETVYQSNGTVNVAVGIVRDVTVINSTSRSVKISVFETDGIKTDLGAPNFSNTTGANLSLRGVTSGANADIFVALPFGAHNSFSRRNYPFTVGKRGDGYLYNANSALTIGTTQGGIRVNTQSISTSFTTGANQIVLSSGNTNTIYADLIITGTNVPSDTYITSIVNATAFNISKATTGSSSGSYILTDPFYDAAGNPIIFHLNGMTANDEVGRWSGNGNLTIGVNTISRDSKLTVGGTANITGNVTFGNNITVAGNATITGTTNALAFRAGANVVVNTTTMFAGNSTINATQTASLLQIANSSSTSNLTAADLKIGTTVVNSSQITTTLVSGNVAGDYANISGQVNTVTLYAATSANIASVVQANSSGIFTTARSNAQNFTAGAGYGAASVGATVNSGTIGISSNTTVNTVVTSSLVSVSNSTSVANLSAVDLRIGSSVVNSSVVAAGANVISNTSAMFVGNSTMNSIVTSTLIRISNSTNIANLSPVDLRIGTSTVNSTAITANIATINVFTVSGNLTLGNSNFVMTSNASHNVVSFGSANVNFDSNTLFIDAMNNRVGLGVNNPDATLQVIGTANISGNLTVGGGFTVGGTFTTTGTTESSGDIIPLSNSYNLGNTSSRWDLFGIDAELTANVSAQNAVIANLVSVGANLSLNTSTITLGNASVYFTTNSSLAQLTGNLVVTNINAVSSILVGANVNVTTSALTIGNTTANMIANSILLRIANSTSIANLTPNELKLGATVVNSIATHSNTISTNTLSSNLVNVGSNVQLTTDTLLIGNSIVNSSVNSIAVAFVNSSATATLNSTAYSGTANNATNFAGQPASYYANATNLTTGTVASARLPQGNATAIGGVQVLDSVVNTSIIIAASANSVKNAYDRAIDANTRAASAQTAAGQAYTNAIAWSGNAALAYANAIAWSGNAALAYANAVTFAANATNLTNGTLPYARIPGNIVNTTAAFTISNVYTYAANIVFSNSTVTATIYANTSNVYFTGIAFNANNSTTVGGNTAATLRNYSETKAAEAYANAVTDITVSADDAYTNAIAWSGNAALAYANAIAWSGNAALAYANATSYTLSRIIDKVDNTFITFAASANSVKNAYDRAIDANTRAASAQSAAVSAYSNAINWSGNAALAYANAIAWSGNAALAYANAIAWSGNSAQAYANAINWSGNAALAYANAVTYVTSQSYANTNQAANATYLTTGTVAIARLPTGTYSGVTGTGTVTTGTWNSGFGATATAAMSSALGIGTNAQRDVTISSSAASGSATAGDIWIQYV